MKNMSPSSSYASIVLALVAMASATMSQTGQTVQVDGIDYFVPPTSVSTIDLTSADKSVALNGEDIDLVPLTVLGDSSISFTGDEFTALVNKYTTSDDVFNKAFLKSIHTSLRDC